MTISNATIKFLRDWHQEQLGAIERGGRLTVDYDTSRLPHCFTIWRGAEFGDLVASVRFHPRGEIISGRVVAPIRDRENPPGMVIRHMPVPFVIRVPSDAMQVEIWFHNFYQTSSRCDAWDSLFGENYWFQIGGAPPQIPMQPVSFRSGAVIRPDLVNVLEQNVVKVKDFQQPTASGPQGINLQTTLTVVA